MLEQIEPKTTSKDGVVTIATFWFVYSLQFARLVFHFNSNNISRYISLTSVSTVTSEGYWNVEGAALCKLVPLEKYRFSKNFCFSELSMEITNRDSSLGTIYLT